jgi:metal-sulfur cluster biosynthetic enzyme
MSEAKLLRAAILEKLQTVIDPETGADVVHMRLIEDLTVDEDGRVFCTFRPSSPFCPLVVSLSQSIQQAIAATEGVTRVEIKVVGFAFADDLMNLLKQAYDEKEQQE